MRFPRRTKLIQVLIAERDAAEVRAERAERLAASYAVQLLALRQSQTRGQAIEAGFADGTLVDGRELVHELGRLAGTELPRAAAMARELMGDKAALTQRADRAEGAVQLLIGAAVDDLELGSDDHDPRASR